MNLKPRPLWLRWLGKGRWITISPNTYFPSGVDPNNFPALVAHEQAHLNQQAGHEVLWLMKYLLRPSFRLAQEAEAIAVELTGYPQSQRDSVIAWYASALSGNLYLWAARSRGLLSPPSPPPSPRGADVNSRKPSAVCDEGFDHTREGKGRRHGDDTRPLEIHPVAITIGVGVLSIILTVLGYFFKSWGDNVTYEIHQPRLVAQDQAKESAANSEWKTDMGRWRDGVDAHFQVIDDRLSMVSHYRNPEAKKISESDALNLTKPTKMTKK